MTRTHTTCGFVVASVVLTLAEGLGQPWPQPIPGLGADGVPPVAPRHLQKQKRKGPQSLRRGRTISVNAFRLGTQSPNVLGHIQVAVDPKSGRVYASGALTDHVVELDPDSGRILRAIRLKFFSGARHKLVLDAKHGVLFHVSHAGGIRAVDLRLGQQTAVLNPAGSGLARPAAGSELPATSSPVADERDGALIFINRAKQLVEKYDKTLRRQASWSVGIAPSHLHLDAEQHRLWVLGGGPDGRGLEAHGMDLDTGRAEAKHRIGPERVQTLRGFARDPSGDFYLMGEALRRVSPEGVGRWAAELPGAAQSLHVFEDLVAVVCRDAQARAENRVECGSVELIEAQTGRLRASVRVGLAAGSCALDRARARLIVGNAGDASVSVVDLRAGKEVGRYPVGASAEQVAPHPRGHAIYVLNRLGGSEVYCCDERTGKHETLRAGRWPAAMALNRPEHRLYVLSHYESMVYVFDTETNRQVGAIGLGLPGCRTDALSDMTYEPATGRLYCALPNFGSVVVVHTQDQNRTELYRPPGLRREPAGGLGKVHASGDGRGRTFYVFVPTRRQVWVYDSESGELIASRTLPLSVGVWAEGGQTRGLLFADPAHRRMFVGACVFSTRSHTLRQTLRGVGSVIAQRGPYLLATRIEGRGRVALCIFEADTLREVGQARLFDSRARRCSIAVDFARNRLYAADMANARVLVFALPTDLGSLIAPER